MKTHILFDFDGTLAYRDSMWTATLIEVLNSNGFPGHSRETIAPVYDFGFPWNMYEKSHARLFGTLSWWEYMQGKIAGMIQGLGIDKSAAEKMARSFKDHYLDLDRWFLFDDTLETLEKMHTAGYECCIVSNHTPELGDLVTGLKIDRFFKHVFNSAVIGYEKPRTEFYSHVLSTLNCSPEHVVMIGDNSIADITGARCHGIDSILVREENESEYQYYAKTLHQAVPIIENL
jgi:putative hydrolase of the HAD superfamily